MIKGCQKKIIHLRNTGSPYFEEAYFIMRDCAEPKPSENDMIKEAMRIAKSTRVAEKPSRSDLLKKALPTLIGACAASLVFGILLLFSAL